MDIAVQGICPSHPESWRALATVALRSGSLQLRIGLQRFHELRGPRTSSGLRKVRNVIE
jgi:hypothetical protein